MGVNSCLWSELEHKSFKANNISAKFFDCELWVKREEGWYIRCGTVS